MMSETEAFYFIFRVLSFGTFSRALLNLLNEFYECPQMKIAVIAFNSGETKIFFLRLKEISRKTFFFTLSSKSDAIEREAIRNCEHNH
jgi:hypothetical protein